MAYTFGCSRKGQTNKKKNHSFCCSLFVFFDLFCLNLRQAGVIVFCGLIIIKKIVYETNTQTSCVNILNYSIKVISHFQSVFLKNMNPEMKIFKQGAEAKLYICQYLGQPALIKERFQKTYRHPDLDTAITKERIKSEARAIVRCKASDVKTPALYLVDFERKRIYMQHFEQSVTVKDFIINMFKIVDGLGDHSNSLDVVAKMIGENVRKLHENNIIHGDLTTSNMLLVPKKGFDINDDSNWLQVASLELVMIDFGLSSFDSSTEDKGVDLYVLERALISTHNDYPDLFGKILDAYKNYSKNNVKEILSKFQEVRARGRKRTMVG